MNDHLYDVMLACALIAEGILFVLWGIAVFVYSRMYRKRNKRNSTRHFDLTD